LKITSDKKGSSPIFSLIAILSWIMIVLLTTTTAVAGQLDSTLLSQNTEFETKTSNVDNKDIQPFSIPKSQLDIPKPPLTLQTERGTYFIRLYWDPVIIEPGKITKFGVLFMDRSQSVLNQVIYDFIVKSSNGTVLKELQDQKAPQGTSVQSIIFDQSGLAPVTVKVRGVVGNPIGESVERADFGIVVNGPRITPRSTTGLNNISSSISDIATTEGAQGKSTYNLTLGDKTYPIKYQITGGKVNGVSIEKDKSTMLVNLSSTSNGKLIIELPRNVIDSKKQGNVDDNYAVFVDGQNTVANEITNNNQVRILEIDFDNGSQQLELSGTQIGTSRPQLLDTSNIKSITNQSKTIQPLKSNKTSDNASLELARVFINDASSNLENHDNATALVHLKLANQQLASILDNSRGAQTIRLLVDDAIKSLDNKEPHKALIHLKLLAEQQFTPTIGRNESTASSVAVVAAGNDTELRNTITNMTGLVTAKRASTIGSANISASLTPETNKTIITNASKSTNTDIFKLTKLFLDDASRAVVGNNTDNALMRLNLARDNLAASSNVSSTAVQTIILLIDDAIESLQRKDIGEAATRIIIAEGRLNSTIDLANQEIKTLPSSIFSPNKVTSKIKAAPENVTKPKAQSSLQKVHSELSKGPAIVNLTILDLAYHPNPVKVKKGDYIQVTNKDPVYQYTVTNDNKSNNEEPGKLFDTGVINPGHSAKFNTLKLVDGQKYPFHDKMKADVKGILEVVKLDTERSKTVVPHMQVTKPRAYTMTISLKNGKENTFDSSITSYEIVNIQNTIPGLASGKYKKGGFDSISVTDTRVYGSFTINVSAETVTSLTTKPNSIFISLPVEDIQINKMTDETTYNLKSYSQIMGHQISGGKLTTDGKQGYLVITVN
jgi:hypothetical protein